MRRECNLTDPMRHAARPGSGVGALAYPVGLIASVVAGFGAGVICEDPAKLTAAVEMLLHEPGLRARAGAASELLGQRPTPGTVWSALRGRIGASSSYEPRFYSPSLLAEADVADQRIRGLRRYAGPRRPLCVRACRVSGTRTTP
jgi:hypothetical protein